MDHLPDTVRGPGSSPPERRLSSEQFEMVIRRAAELQARAAEDPGADGLSEAEALRIGRELGLSGVHLTRALAEVRGAGAVSTGLVDRVFGEAVLEATRTVAGEAEPVRRLLEDYLLRREFMVVQRRFPDRTVYERASGVVAVLGRASSGVFTSHAGLRVPTLTVAVQPLEEGYSFVSLSTALTGRRAGYLAGAVLGGGGGAGAVGAALGIAVAPPAALLAVPMLAGAVYGFRWIYSEEARRVRTRLEALLDRLEHGELPAPAVRGRGLFR